MKILIVEDNEKLAAHIKAGLEHEGFAAECVHNGHDAEKKVLVRRDEYDLIILDVMLPQKNGLEVCASWREQKVHIPVLMLTARDATDDTVNGLNAGADDYLVKPFDFAELVARVRALLRRPSSVKRTILVAGSVTLDTVSHRVTHDDVEVALTLKEFMVLEYLLRNRGAVVTRDTLYDHAWDFADTAVSNTINVHIKNIREKLYDHEASLIQTVRGVGYKVE
jgi:DNA-binding response OmpR family regulator